jgi:hypothetical protein
LTPGTTAALRDKAAALRALGRASEAEQVEAQAEARPGG